MDSNCKQLRDRLLDERLDAEGVRRDPHLAGCADCRAWVERALRNVEHLAGLAPLAAPAALDARVERALNGLDAAEERAVVAVEGLSRLPAPAGLDEMILADLARVLPDESLRELRAAASEPRVVRVLRTLERHQAPHVLARLVAEELADPAKARARRFAGDLERLSAPVQLWRRLERRLRIESGGAGSGPEISRRRLKLVRAVSGLAAAALLVVLPFALLGGSDTRRGSTRFRVEKATSISQLSPMARSLVDGLSGGALSARSDS